MRSPPARARVGNLVGLDIAPNALRDYTHHELEDIIGDVIRRTRADMGQRSEMPVRKLSGLWLNGFDHDVLGESHAGIPRAAT